MSIYDQIYANKRKSVMLMLVFIVILAGLGYVIGVALEAGYTMFIFATVFAVISTVISYFYSANIALSMSGAKEITKQDEPRLFTTVENLSIGAGLVPMPKVYLIYDMAINAFAAGRDPKHSVVAITKGALTKLDDLELEGVIAHELSHIRNYDIRTMTIAVVLVGIIALVSEWFLRFSFWGGNDRDNNKGNGLTIAFAIIGAILAPLIAQLLKFALSRQREYLADASAALLTRYPEGLAQALEKIKLDHDQLSHANSATAHLYIANPFKNVGGKISHLFSTHPPVDDRIQRLRSM